MILAKEWEAAFADLPKTITDAALARAKGLAGMLASLVYEDARQVTKE